MKIVISDTSPILALHHLGYVHLLHDLFRKVVIPIGVREEVLRKTSPSLVLPDFIVVEAPSDLQRVQHLRLELDQGEAEAIALALQSHDSLLLVDERKATHVARSYGLHTIGVLGLLLEGKRIGIVRSVSDSIASLRTGLRFYVSPSLVHEIIKLAGEEP